MRFSVVITTHNRRVLLDRAIRSALAQPLAVETIVVDDASSDDTEAHVKRLQAELRAAGDDRLIYHRNTRNCGHSTSVNIGVNLATGEWIKFLDDDDYLGLQCLSAMATALAAHPNAAICSCKAAQVDEREREIERSPSTGPGQSFYVPQEDIHYGMLLEVVPFGTPVQVAVKRSAFIESGGWNSSYDGNCDDIDSWIRIAQFGDAVFLNQCLVYRTVWPGSLNQKFAIARRLQTNIEMKRKIYELVHPKYRSYLPEIREVERYLHLHWGLVGMCGGHIRTGLTTITATGISKVSLSLLLRALVFRQSPWFVQQSHVTVRRPSVSQAQRDRTFPSTQVPPPSATALNFLSLYSLPWRTEQGLSGSISALFPPADSVASNPLEYPHSSVPHAPRRDLDLSPHKRTQMLHRRIRIRNLWQTLLAGNVRLALRLSGSIFSGYARRGLMQLYPATPPIAKIPISASSQDHAEMTIDILKRIVNRSRPPNLIVLRRYLKIRCAIAAFKQGYWLMGFCTAIPAFFSLSAWKLWLRLQRAQQLQAQEESIRKIFLTPVAPSVPPSSSNP